MTVHPGKVSRESGRADPSAWTHCRTLSVNRQWVPVRSIRACGPPASRLRVDDDVGDIAPEPIAGPRAGLPRHFRTCLANGACPPPEVQDAGGQRAGRQWLWSVSCPRDLSRRAILPLAGLPASRRSWALQAGHLLRRRLALGGHASPARSLTSAGGWRNAGAAVFVAVSSCQKGPKELFTDPSWRVSEASSRAHHPLTRTGGSAVELSMA